MHPTQLYESLVGVLLLLLLLWARKKQRFRGQIFFLFTFVYGFVRFMLEIVRDDPERGNLPGSLPEHVLLPACLALFAVGYVFSFARLVENQRFRRVTQVLVFVPALVVAIVLRPETFAGDVLVQLSTSQFIGVASGLAVCVAYFLFDNAAETHPEAAMDIYLDGYEPPQAQRTTDDSESDDESEGAAEVKRKSNEEGRSQQESEPPDEDDDSDEDDDFDSDEDDFEDF